MFPHEKRSSWVGAMMLLVLCVNVEADTGRHFSTVVTKSYSMKDNANDKFRSYIIDRAVKNVNNGLLQVNIVNLEQRKAVFDKIRKNLSMAYEGSKYDRLYEILTNNTQILEGFLNVLRNEKPVNLSNNTRQFQLRSDNQTQNKISEEGVPVRYDCRDCGALIYATDKLVKIVFFLTCFSFLAGLYICVKLNNTFDEIFRIRLKIKTKPIRNRNDQNPYKPLTLKPGTTL